VHNEVIAQGQDSARCGVNGSQSCALLFRIQTQLSELIGAEGKDMALHCRYHTVLSTRSQRQGNIWERDPSEFMTVSGITNPKLPLPVVANRIQLTPGA